MAYYGKKNCIFKCVRDKSFLRVKQSTYLFPGQKLNDDKNLSLLLLMENLKTPNSTQVNL